MANLTVGTVVEVVGSEGGRAVPGTEFFGLHAALEETFVGVRAQLLEYHCTQEKWFAVTTQGTLLMVASKNITPVRDHLGFDVFLGPASQPELIATQISQCLVDNSFARVQMVLAERHRQELVDMAEQLDHNFLLTRMPIALEKGYLGKDGNGKTLVVDFQDKNLPPPVQASAVLAQQDKNISVISGMLMGYAEEHLGFVLHSRTPLLLRQSFTDTLEEAYHLPRAATREESTQFLSIMHRKKVTVLQFVGPGGGEVTLLPRREAVLDEVSVAASPGSMLIFLCEDYDFCYRPDGKALTLQAWFLDQPPEFTLKGEVAGNLEALSLGSRGPEPPRTTHKIKIIGTGVRMPGKSDNINQYYNCYRHAGVDGMLEIPFTRYDMNVYSEWRWDRQTAVNQGKMYSRHQGHIEGIELFDNMYFHVSNNEAGGMDPEQRQTLEVGWNTLLDGGYHKEQLVRKGGHIGVYVGQNESDWNYVPLPGGSGAMNCQAIIAGRFTYIFNLKGPCTIMNTACSSALTALHNAKLNTRSTDGDPVEAFLIVGVSMNVTYHVFYGNCITNALSFMGRSFTFDASADGFGRSEGCTGCLIKEGDMDEESYAMLAGTGINHDGRSASLTAPNGPAQEKCVRAVMVETKMSPPEIDCFECHGTGTSLGDPIEIGAFKRLYNRAPRYTPVLSTSSKSNMGHTEANAGMAGFLKCVIMCMHSEIAANVHLRELNPHLEMEGFPNYFLTEATTTTGFRSYSGVSSFGVSGTNGHCLAYGKNIRTSRAIDKRNTRSLMLGKIRSAAEKVSLPSGTDWQEWEDKGTPYTSVPGSKYEVEVDNSGTVTWRALQTQILPDRAGPFFLTGSFNHWRMEQLISDENVDGLHMVEIEVGDSGQESFQVVYSHLEDMAFYPSQQNCTRKTVRILGPAAAPSREDAWLIRSEPNTYFRVEFFVFKSLAKVAINWMPIKD